MIACFDVDYQNKRAQAACIIFDQWSDASPVASYTKVISPVADYVSGQFYKRELPCILGVYDLIKEPINYIVLDSYVYLNSAAKPGLGAYLYDHFKQQIPIIGVAKNAFKEDNKLAISILRGGSQKPLYISSAGVETQLAAQWVTTMHGQYRFPTLLKAVDQLARNW